MIGLQIARVPFRPAYEGPLLLNRRVRLAQAAQQYYPGMAPPSDPATSLAQQGAIVQVTVGPPSAGGGGQQQQLQAMIDTGASISGITLQAAQQLGLQAVGSTQLGGVGGTSQAPIYAAALAVPQFNVSVDPLQIAGVSAGLPVDMLIGRDILRNLILTYYGVRGNFTLAQDTSAPAPAPAPAPGAQVPVAGQPQGPPPPPIPGTQAALPQPPPSAFPVWPVVAGVGAAALTAGAFLLKIF